MKEILKNYIIDQLNRGKVWCSNSDNKYYKVEVGIHEEIDTANINIIYYDDDNNVVNVKVFSITNYKQFIKEARDDKFKKIGI